jgi:hypothetical protein
MLQVFHADVAKVDRDVAIVVLVCCKLLFSMFHLFFHTHIASVYIWMLHMFYTYVASALFGCCVCFTMVFKCFFMCFCNWFTCMFQVLYLPSDIRCKCCIWMF